MSCAYQRTGELFAAAVHSDDDFGYPNRVQFVPGDQEWTDDAVWRSLTEGHPTLLVGECSELLLVPLRRSIIDRLCKGVTARVEFRINGQRGEFAVSSRIRRHDFDDLVRHA